MKLEDAALIGVPGLAGFALGLCVSRELGLENIYPDFSDFMTALIIPLVGAGVGMLAGAVAVLAKDHKFKTSH